MDEKSGPLLHPNLDIGIGKSYEYFITILWKLSYSIR